MTTHEYLSQIKLYDERVERAIEQIARLEAAACSISAPPSNREKVQTSRKGDKLSNNVAKLIDIEREDYLNFAFKSKEIIRQIEEIDEPKREVLLKRYGQGLRKVDIAQKMHLTARHVSRLLDEGIADFEKQYGWLYLKLAKLKISESSP